MQAQRHENMQAHMINHVHIRKVEKKVDEMSEVVGCIAAGVVFIAFVVIALLILALVF